MATETWAALPIAHPGLLPVSRCVDCGEPYRAPRNAFTSNPPRTRCLDCHDAHHRAIKRSYRRKCAAERRGGVAVPRVGWSESDTVQLRELAAEGLSCKQIAARMDLFHLIVRSHATEHHISIQGAKRRRDPSLPTAPPFEKRGRGRKRDWTPQEDVWLLTVADRLPLRSIARDLGRGMGAVTKRLYLLRCRANGGVNQLKLEDAYRTYEKSVMHVAYRWTHDRDRAYDLAMGVWVKAAEIWPVMPWSDINAIGPYLRVMVKNAAIAAWRERQALPMLHLSTIDENRDLTQIEAIG